MKEAIRQHARELGFDACRITTTEPPESAPQLRQWLAEGQHGEMLYLQRNANKRVEPQQVLPGARSVVTLAASYVQKSTVHSPQSTVHGPQSVAGSPQFTGDRLGVGIIARYARYEDYHLVLGNRLKLLTEYIDQLGGPGTRSLWYVDTGPLPERDLAQRAGLGFIGKHTNLISRQFGNWIFLCEIITTLELKPDKPENNHCGSCTRCIAACPTGAIKAPFQLDARRCISYLTIELKGTIPLELRPAIGNRIYGCDDCLAVCPWNRFAREGEIMQGHARPDLSTPDLLELLAVDETEFKRRFAGTPMLRTKRRGLLRNVCVALGNTADQTALPALHKATGDPEPLAAEHARWAIEQVQARINKGLPIAAQ